MSESNKNIAQELTGSIDDAYSHGFSEALGFGNWRGEPHNHQSDGVDVRVGGKYYALFPEDDKKDARIVDNSREGITEEHWVQQERSHFTPGEVAVRHMMGVNYPLNKRPEEVGGVGVKYAYEDNYDADGTSNTGAKEDHYNGKGELVISSANGPKIIVSTWRYRDGVSVSRKGPNGEVGAVKRLTGNRALRAQEIMQARAARRISESVNKARKDHLVNSDG